ncbi:hypothetical protein BK004_01620 [bacterium CG10_46_32]|nr:MAG: hypothetical protein BK004_01620 [bacterium CG10_46_32]PIR56282.1 MAG: hypothetical protein COU73_01640 [Parcubacteria group bacterium CG10_big_fil_rev_8_21_14_0_10_46_32]
MSVKKHPAQSIASLLIAAAVMFGVFGHLAPSNAVVSPAVGAYLASINPQTDWTVMAAVALGAKTGDTSFLKTLDGNTANDYATYILAIAALGKDPRAYGNENLVYGLRQKASSGQIGDANILSDDMFGILALRAAGVPATDALITQTVSYLKSKQLADGGWDWSSSSTESSVDYTAMGIMALISAGVSPSDDAIFAASDYLLVAQNDDGGFPIAPGQASNTASTAWVLSSLHAMGDDPGFWAVGGKTPEVYLNAQLYADGYFLFDAQSHAADQFTPTATSYAAIALAGKYYPVASITAPPSVSLRIEGQEETICDIQSEGATALDAIKSVAQACGYTYTIEDTQYGPYLTTIAGETAAGMDGWSYLPNYETAQVGAGEYVLSEGDELVWYYGAWDDAPLRVVHDVTTVVLGDTTTAVIQKYVNSSWQPYAGAILSRASETFTSNANGQVDLTWSQDGMFYLVAEADGHVRSNAILVTAGDAGAQANLPLLVTVGSVVPVDEPPLGGVSFGVSGDLNFGTLNPGQSSTKQATIVNNGSGGIITTASVAGSSLFTNYLTLDNVVPPQWQKSISGNTTTPVGVTLSIPASYTTTQTESGTLIFWAHAAN